MVLVSIRTGTSSESIHLGWDGLQLAKVALLWPAMKVEIDLFKTGPFPAIDLFKSGTHPRSDIDACM